MKPEFTLADLGAALQKILMEKNVTHEQDKARLALDSNGGIFRSLDAYERSWGRTTIERLIEARDAAQVAVSGLFCHVPVIRMVTETLEWLICAVKNPID